MTTSRGYFDRLTRTWSDEPPHGVVLSSQLVLEGPVHLDREEFRGRVLLVDNDEGVTSIQANGKQVNMPVMQGTRRDSLKATLDVADRLRQWRVIEPTWRDLVRDVDPLILLKDISELLKVDAIEHALAEDAAPLRGVFHTPFAELEFSTERTPAPRARRISRRAVQVLAARSEDWIRAGASGITPRTVEALVREELVDVYENRVAARLIDDVRRHLLGVLGIYDGLEPLVQEIRGPYRKAHRLSALWGRQPPDDELREALERRRQRVGGLLRLIDELRDSRLYNGVPARARVGQPIRVTNLLVQDTNYRAVRRLWSEWWATRRQQGTLEERRAAQLNEAESFFDFAWLTVSHALLNLEDAGQLGAEHDGSMAITTWGAVGLQQADSFDDGAWVLTVSSATGEADRYRGAVLAVACEFLRGEVTDISQSIDLLVSRVGFDGCQDVLVLFPGTAKDLAEAAIAVDRLGAFGPLGAVSGSAHRNVWLVPVSPLDLESTERVERVLRWWVIGSALLSYPPKIVISGAARQAVGPQPFLKAGRRSGEVELTEVPTDGDHSQLRQHVQQESTRLRQRRGTGKGDAEQLPEFLERLELAREELMRLSTCPVCGSFGDLEGLSPQTFRVECQTCSTRWGLRHDPSSAHRVPYLWIGEDLASLPAGPELTTWLGRDVLADPCVSPEAGYSLELINPWTGRCTASASQAASCERCGRHV